MDYERLMNKKNENGKDAVDLLNEATQIMDKDNFKGAIDLLSEAVELCGHPRLYFNMGYCYYQLKDYKNAIIDFENSLANDRGNDLLKHERQRLFLYLGIIHEKNKDNDKAIEAYKNSADWGYEGALAKLENLGVLYVPDEPKAVPYNPEAAQKNRHAKQKSRTQQKLRMQSKLNKQTKKNLEKKQTTKKNNDKSAPAAVKKITPASKKTKFILSAAAGFIFGIILILILINLPKNENQSSSARKRQEITATVISDAIQLRSEPYNNSLILKLLYSGNIVNVTGNVLGDWTPVEYEGIKGWVNSEVIEVK